MVYITLLEADRRFNSCKLPRAQMYWEAADERSYLRVIDGNWGLQ